MYTGNNWDNLDQEKLILMLQVRQLSLVTSHPYFSFAGASSLHYTQNIFGLYFCLFFVNKVIPMQLPIKGVWPVEGP